MKSEIEELDVEKLDVEELDIDELWDDLINGLRSGSVIPLTKLGNALADRGSVKLQVKRSIPIDEITNSSCEEAN